MGELCLVAKFGQKLTNKDEKRAKKMKNDCLKRVEIENKNQKQKEELQLKILKSYIKGDTIHLTIHLTQYKRQ